SGAPAGDEGARERGITEIDGERVVDDATHPSGCHRPTLCTAILIEPRLYLIETLSEPARRYTDANTDRKPLLRLRDHQPRASCHDACPGSVAEDLGSRKSRPVISILASSVSCRWRSFRSATRSSRVRCK